VNTLFHGQSKLAANRISDLLLLQRQLPDDVHVIYAEPVYYLLSPAAAPASAQLVCAFLDLNPLGSGCFPPRQYPTACLQPGHAENGSCR